MNTQTPLRQAYELASQSGKFTARRLERALALAQDPQTQIGSSWIEVLSESAGWRRITTHGGMIGACDCPDCQHNIKANHGWCAHRIAAALIVKARVIRSQEMAEVEKQCRRERMEARLENSATGGYELWR